MQPDPDPLHLRLARSADAAAMAAWSRDLIETGLAWKYDAARVTALIHDAETVALVAVAAPDADADADADTRGAVHGFAILQVGEEHAHLVLLCVSPQHQRRGLGRTLLQWLLKSARVAGMAAVDLELRADNPQALAFYGALGFVETLRLADYYGPGIDARRMRLQLRVPVAQGTPRWGPGDATG